MNDSPQHRRASTRWSNRHRPRLASPKASSPAPNTTNWLYRRHHGDDAAMHRNAANCGSATRGPAADRSARAGQTARRAAVDRPAGRAGRRTATAAIATNSTGLRTAKRQLRRWQDEYTFDYAGAMSAVSEFFRKRSSVNPCFPFSQGDVR